MSNLDEVDFFSDATLLSNPHPYFESLRAQGPAVRISPYGVVAVTDYDTGLAVFRDDEHFSNLIVSNGPFPPLPFTPQGDDITEQIEAHRHQVPNSMILGALDPPHHTRVKSLLMGMITPKRLQENEEYLWRLADQQIDGFIDRGSVELVSEYARPFTTFAIAELLGVPPEDYDKIRSRKENTTGEIGVGSTGGPINPFERIAIYFGEYIERRRREPQRDVLGDLANVRYADGTLPPVEDVVKVATFLFGAGEDTTARVISASVRILAEDPELQRRLRTERQLIPDYVEEVLRLEGTVRSDFRLVKKRVQVAGQELTPGTLVMMLIPAMNRDPHRFDNPTELRLDRKNLRNHVAFGRGIHTCAGAPLARAEVKVSLERLLERTSEIRIDEGKHGHAGARRYDLLPSYMLQGLMSLHLELSA